MTLFKDRGSKEVIKVNCGHKGGPQIQYQEEDSAGQEESPHQKSILLAPWSWTSGLQSCEK